MVVTESRPTRFFESQFGTCNLVTLISPVPAGGAELNLKPNHEPHKCWRWRCVWRHWHFPCQLLYSAVLCNPPRLTLASHTSRHGERRPPTNTRPRIPQAPLLIYLLVPPTTSVQRISHPHRTRARLLQRPARPRHSSNFIKPIRLERSEDPSPPHHSPRCVSRSRKRRAHSDVGRSHDRMVGQMGNHRCGCVRSTSLVFGNC